MMIPIYLTAAPFHRLITEKHNPPSISFPYRLRGVNEPDDTYALSMSKLAENCRSMYPLTLLLLSGRGAFDTFATLDI